MEKQIQQLIIQMLEEKGYAVTVESDGIYVDDEDITTSIKISTGYSFDITRIFL